jgi:tetratricopeptide (TPR) repeat protein
MFYLLRKLRLLPNSAQKAFMLPETHQPQTPNTNGQPSSQNAAPAARGQEGENFGRIVHFIRYSNYPPPIHAHGNIICKPIDFFSPVASTVPLATKGLSLPLEQEDSIPLPAPGDFLYAPLNTDEAINGRVFRSPEINAQNWPAMNQALPANFTPLQRSANSLPLAPENAQAERISQTAPIEMPNTPCPNIPIYTAPAPPRELEWTECCDEARAAAQKGKFEIAERLLLQALEIAGQFHNRDPRMPQTLDRLTSLYYNCGEYDKALACALETLVKTRNVYGHMHCKVASCMNNIAGIYFCQNLHHKAEPFCIEVLEIYKSLHDDGHADIGMAHNNLGFLYHAQGQLELAKEHYEAALPIRRQALGCHHPSVRLLVDGYIELLEQLGEHAQAQFIRATKSDTDSGWSLFSKQVIAPRSDD